MGGDARRLQLRGQPRHWGQAGPRTAFPFHRRDSAKSRDETVTQGDRSKAEAELSTKSALAGPDFDCTMTEEQLHHHTTRHPGSRRTAEAIRDLLQTYVREADPGSPQSRRRATAVAGMTGWNSLEAEDALQARQVDEQRLPADGDEIKRTGKHEPDHAEQRAAHAGGHPVPRRAGFVHLA